MIWAFGVASKSQKKRTMKQHADRNAQFENIERLKKEYLDAGKPVLSMDTKKKELLGNFYREGVTDGVEPTIVNDHDFPYRKEVVEWFEQKQWDFSISVTNSNNCRPVLEFIDGLPDSAWTAIRSDGTEEAIFSCHQPDKWQREQSYIVTRSWHDGRQWLIEPRYGVILVSRTDLPATGTES